MNWSSAKNILIIFFVCTNLFLLIVLLFFSDNTPRVSEEIVASASEILRKNGIEVPEKLMMRKNEPVYIPEAVNIIENKDNFIKKLLGENVSEKSENIFSSPNGTLSFYGDFFEFLPSEEYLKKETVFSDTTNRSAFLSKITSLFSLDGSDLVFTTTEINGKNVLNITKEQGNMRFFCCSVDVEYTKNSVEKISGIWFSEKGRKSEAVEQKPLSALMINYLSQNESLQVSKTVTDIVSGYYIPQSNVYHERLYLTPCIKIIFSDGSFFYETSAEETM